MKLITFLLGVCFTGSAFAESLDSPEAYFEDGEDFVDSGNSDLDQKGCFSWPVELKTLRECCVLPEAIHYFTVKGCRDECLAKDFNVSAYTGVNCVVDCFVEKTGVWKDGAFDKTAAKKMYKTYYNQWEPIIKDGINQCNYNPSGPLEKNLAKYFDCVDNYLAQNCLHFKETSECKAVQERFDTCNNVPENCTKWPANLFLPAFCCDIPKMYPKSTSKCKSQCSKAELFRFKRKRCEKDCTHRETGMITKLGTINFRVAETLLIKNLNTTDLMKWESTIKSAILGCELALKDFNSEENKVFLMSNFERCIRINLSNKCEDFHLDPYCHPVKRYLKKCPATKPWLELKYEWTNTVENGF